MNVWLLSERRTYRLVGDCLLRDLKLRCHPYSGKEGEKEGGGERGSHLDAPNASH